MYDFEEKSMHKLPIPLPMKKDCSPQDSDDNTEEGKGDEGEAGAEEANEVKTKEEEETKETPKGPMDPRLRNSLVEWPQLCGKSSRTKERATTRCM